MLRQGGLRPFFVGASATVTRDLVFGGFFALFRNEIRLLESQKEGRMSNYVIDVFSASLATLLSSPFNYVRNVHYATPPNVPALSARTILFQLWRSTLEKENLASALRHLQSRLRLGWGTARVGCGMAFGAQVYAWCAHHSKAYL